jgi:hypothetical protein
MIQLNIGSFLLHLQNPVTFLATFWFSWITLLAWYFHGIRAKWKSPPKGLVLSGVVVFIIWMSVTLFFSLNFERIYSEGSEAFANLMTFQAFLGELIKIIVGLIILFAYMKPRQVVETERINTVIIIWRIIGLSIFIPGLFGFTTYLLTSMLGLPIPKPIFDILEFLLTSDAPFILIDFGSTVSNAILVILTLYLALRYPEFLLVCEAQVLRLCRLYTEIQILKESSFEEKWGFDHIKEYIQSVPMAVFEKNCPDIDEL